MVSRILSLVIAEMVSFAQRAEDVDSLQYVNVACSMFGPRIVREGKAGEALAVVDAVQEGVERLENGPLSLNEILACGMLRDQVRQLRSNFERANSQNN